ncbi:uncharacterized protein LOC62_04G006036 [Vanrija pseudolonga]|uniref:Uncharacterized protein n=1 Tax=Vanrija pseudolonga TaxID=143232 RepID=A0AAF0Y9T5_9TREE|nr:hypothetical protein LOC62_04G006036 [Vanrija pseudolonga]
MISVPPLLAGYLHAPCYPLLCAALAGAQVTLTQELVDEACDLAAFVASGAGNSRHVATAERLRYTVLLERERETARVQADAGARLAGQMAALGGELRAVVSELGQVRANLAAMEAELRVLRAGGEIPGTSLGLEAYGSDDGDEGEEHDAVDDGTGLDDQRGTGAHTDAGDDEPDLIAFSPVPSVAADLPGVAGDDVPNPVPAQQSLVITKPAAYLALDAHYNPSSPPIPPQPPLRKRPDDLDAIVRAIVLLVYAVGVVVLSSNKDV